MSPSSPGAGLWGTGTHPRVPGGEIVPVPPPQGRQPPATPYSHFEVMGLLPPKHLLRSLQNHAASSPPS